MLALDKLTGNHDQNVLEVYVILVIFWHGMGMSPLSNRKWFD
jgi:hypothetical protein